MDDCFKNMTHSVDVFMSLIYIFICKLHDGLLSMKGNEMKTCSACNTQIRGQYIVKGVRDIENPTILPF